MHPPEPPHTAITHQQRHSSDSCRLLLYKNSTHSHTHQKNHTDLLQHRCTLRRVFRENMRVNSACRHGRLNTATCSHCFLQDEALFLFLFIYSLYRRRTTFTDIKKTRILIQQMHKKAEKYDNNSWDSHDWTNKTLIKAGICCLMTTRKMFRIFFSFQLLDMLMWFLFWSLKQKLSAQSLILSKRGGVTFPYEMFGLEWNYY